MNIDVKKTKQTKLGRAWLDALVTKVWAALPNEARERIWWARSAMPNHDRSVRMFVSPTVGPVERAADRLLTELGALGDPLCVVDFNSARGSGRWLTPFGIEIYNHGRKQDRR